MGIGFAIPSSMAKSVMVSLQKHGKVIRGWTGISIQELTPELANEFGAKGVAGVLVADVMEGGPAAKAKLERGNIITTYDGKPVKNPTQLRMASGRDRAWNHGDTHSVKGGPFAGGCRHCWGAPEGGGAGWAERS